MKKLILILAIYAGILLSDGGNDIINIGNISFVDMNLTNDFDTTYEDVLYSRQRVSELTVDKSEVILYFFDLHIC